MTPKSNIQIDQETRLHEDDHHSIKLWLRLITCTSLIESDIRNALRIKFGTTLPRFDFLAQLERVPDGLTMGELSKRMMVSGGNVSGIATQLVNEGLISREAVPSNRRTFIVKLTTKGRRVFKTIAARHEEWIISLLGHLQQDEVEQLMNLLDRVKTGLR